MGRINPEDLEFSQYVASQETGGTKPKLAAKFRQDLAAYNNFGNSFTYEKVKGALWHYIHEAAAGYGKKYETEIHQAKRTLVINQDIAMLIAAQITSYLDKDEFKKAGRMKSDEGEELQIQYLAQAIKDFLEQRKLELQSFDPESTQYRERSKTIEIINLLIE